MDIRFALLKLAESGGIHWRGIYSPQDARKNVQTRYAKRDPIIIPGMDKKRARITEAGIAFLRQQADAAEGS